MLFRSTIITVTAIVNGGTSTTTIAYGVPLGSTTVQTFNGQVSSTTADTNTANNTATAQVSLTPVADLAITISAPASGTPGQTITATVTIVNNGPSTANAVTATIVLPNGVTSTITVTAIVNGGTSTTTIAYSVPLGSVTTQTFSGQVSSTTLDTNPGNNTATAATPLTPVADLAITSFAIGCHHAFIYLRGEVVHVYRRLLRAIEEAYAAGYLGKNILGSGFDLDITLHAGAGAYICGEETALLDSLEGRRGQPRLKPPFPAVAGLYARPTVVNNVESIASIAPILLRGAEWFADMGTEKSNGFGIFSLSGHVTRPGQYEAPLGITLRELLEMAGGMRGGRKLKFWTPGGSSTPMFTDQHLDVPLDFESVAAAGSMLGTRALQIFDETVSVVRAVSRWTDFYAHESCGKCTPCREGTFWLKQIMERLEHGKGSQDDIDKLLDICSNIFGRSFCPLADGAVSPITSAVQYFREEFEAGMHTPAADLFPPRASTLFAKENVTA